MVKDRPAADEVEGGVVKIKQFCIHHVKLCIESFLFDAFARLTDGYTGKVDSGRPIDLPLVAA